MPGDNLSWGRDFDRIITRVKEAETQALGISDSGHFHNDLLWKDQP